MSWQNNMQSPSKPKLSTQMIQLNHLQKGAQNEAFFSSHFQLGETQKEWVSVPTPKISYGGVCPATKARVLPKCKTNAKKLGIWDQIAQGNERIPAQQNQNLSNNLPTAANVSKGNSVPDHINHTNVTLQSQIQHPVPKHTNDTNITLQRQMQQTVPKHTNDTNITLQSQMQHPVPKHTNDTNVTLQRQMQQTVPHPTINNTNITIQSQMQDTQVTNLNRQSHAQQNPTGITPLCTDMSLFLQNPNRSNVLYTDPKILRQLTMPIIVDPNSMISLQKAADIANALNTKPNKNNVQRKTEWPQSNWSAPQTHNVNAETSQNETSYPKLPMILPKPRTSDAENFQQNVSVPVIGPSTSETVYHDSTPRALLSSGKPANTQNLIKQTDTTITNTHAVSDQPLVPSHNSDIPVSIPSQAGQFSESSNIISDQFPKTSQNETIVPKSQPKHPITLPKPRTPDATNNGSVPVIFNAANLVQPHVSVNTAPKQQTVNDQPRNKLSKDISTKKTTVSSQIADQSNNQNKPKESQKTIQQNEAEVKKSLILKRMLLIGEACFPLWKALDDLILIAVPKRNYEYETPSTREIWSKLLSVFKKVIFYHNDYPKRDQMAMEAFDLIEKLSSVVTKQQTERSEIMQDSVSNLWTSIINYGIKMGNVFLRAQNIPQKDVMKSHQITIKLRWFEIVINMLSVVPSKPQKYRMTEINKSMKQAIEMLYSFEMKIYETEECETNKKGAKSMRNIDTNPKLRMILPKPPTRDAANFQPNVVVPGIAPSTSETVYDSTPRALLSSGKPATTQGLIKQTDTTTTNTHTVSDQPLVSSDILDIPVSTPSQAGQFSESSNINSTITVEMGRGIPNTLLKPSMYLKEGIHNSDRISGVEKCVTPSDKVVTSQDSESSKPQENRQCPEDDKVNVLLPETEIKQEVRTEIQTNLLSSDSVHSPVSPTPNNLFTCPFCNKNCGSEMCLLGHLNILHIDMHNFTCLFCKKVTQKLELFRHLRVHSVFNSISSDTSSTSLQNKHPHIEELHCDKSQATFQKSTDLVLYQEMICGNDSSKTKIQATTNDIQSINQTEKVHQSPPTKSPERPKLCARYVILLYTNLLT